MLEPHETLTFTGSNDHTFTTTDELHEFWNEQTKLSAQQRLDNPTEQSEGAITGHCDCYYRIIDITVPAHDPNALDTSLEFASGGLCNPVGAQLPFTRDHHATGACIPIAGGPLPLPNLTPDPLELIPFSCPLPKYWNGGSPFFAYYENTMTCIDGNSLSTINNEVSITFQILCKDENPNPDLSGCQGDVKGEFKYYFASPIVKLIIPEDGLYTMTPGSLHLNGCGCKPVFYAN